VPAVQRGAERRGVEGQDVRHRHVVVEHPAAAVAEHHQAVDLVEEHREVPRARVLGQPLPLRHHVDHQVGAVVQGKVELAGERALHAEERPQRDGDERHQHGEAVTQRERALQ
jgi:hypothetical protein